MSEKEKRILETFGNIIPDLTEIEKEKLLSYGEGYAAGIRSRKDPPESRMVLAQMEANEISQVV